MNSLASNTNPSVAATLITNINVRQQYCKFPINRFVVLYESAERNRFVKTSLLDFAEGDRVLYLDADAEVAGDLGLPRLRLTTGLCVHAATARVL